MAVLYRKYRPQTFAEVVNQKHIIQTLKNQVAAGQVAHAYLFTGSRGVGKTSVARILAKAVNCLGASGSAGPLIGKSARQPGDACGECDVCKQIEAGNFLDLVEIDAASNTGVENVRDLIEHVKFAPSIGKYKVFIIDEVHMLSKQAFNALLKTLEEPPSHTIFILATTEINKVLPTIISRTQRFDFKTLSPADILGQLQYIAKQENLNFNPEILELVANNAEGSARDALSLLDKLLTLGDELTLEDSQQLLGITDIAVCEKLSEYIVEGKLAELPAFFEGLMEGGADFAILNRDYLEYLRKVLVYKITDDAEGFGLADTHRDALKSLAAKLTIQDIMFVIRLFLRSYKELDSSPSQELPLLLASLEAAQKKDAGLRAKGTVDSEAKSSKVSLKSFAGHIHNSGEPVGSVTAITSQASLNEPKSAPQVESVVVEPVAPLEVLSHDENLSGDTVELPEARIFWPKVISEVKKINSPLANLLKSCELLETKGNKIIVGVKYLFNQQHLSNAKNIDTIMKVLKLVSGKNLSLSTEVQKQPQPETATVGALSDALKVFGGELIE
ncbi:MAG: DNA polymerase III subunit gamma/tau [Candidatus Doudnabacteria bacterium]|nr:DNA polymerase III subunit gamma/tau [Candidatus Doudnabacteria bacterium]